MSFSCCWPCFYINHHAVCELTCSSDFRDKKGSTEINGGGTGPPMYHLPGNVISVTVGPVYCNLQPEYELPNSTRFGQWMGGLQNRVEILSKISTG